jgi:hypothetical protein
LFGYAKRFYTGIYENRLIHTGKVIAPSFHKRGPLVFTRQLGKRPHVSQCIAKFKRSVDLNDMHDITEEDNCDSIASNLSEPDVLEAHPQLKSNSDYTINCINGIICATWNTRTKVEIPSTIILFVREEFICHGVMTLNLYTGYKRDAIMYWAHPNYRGEEPWYDWCMVEYEPLQIDRTRASVNIEESAYPAGYYLDKLLVFVLIVDNDGEESIPAIIHTCESKNHTMDDSCLT